MLTLRVVQRLVLFIGFILSAVGMLALTALSADAEGRSMDAIAPAALRAPAAARSCDEDGLNAALAAGGTNTFSCAGATTITVSATKTVSVTGTVLDGGGLLTISGGGIRQVFVVSPSVTATFQYLTIANGYDGYAGGGIENQGTLTIRNSTISGNTASFAGGGISSSGTLTISNSTFSNNHANYGGGIWNSSSGTLTISNSTFSGNGVSCYGATCAALGGGIENDTGSTMTITNSTFSGNSAQCDGGAWCLAGGGGIFNYSKVTISNSTFSGNTVHCPVDGCFAYGGGIYVTGTVTITNSTFSTNSASCRGECIARGGGVSNGGFFNTGSPRLTGTMTITNSTFFSNTVECNGSRCFGGGGGIENYDDSTVTIINSTLSGNSATCSGSSCSFFVGGIENYYGTLNFANTIIANSVHGDCGNDNGTIGTNTNNLVQDGTCTPFLSGNPKLGGLANNGGPTQTMALGANSPAINAGDSATCAASPVSGKDQRGLPRRSGFCDIGAFEAQPASITAVSGSPQNATINTAFALPLKTNVKDGNTNALGGVVITYTVPSSGASAILSSGTATSNVNGDASVTATANGTAGGPYNVAAASSGLAPVNFSLTNNPYSTATGVTSSPNPSFIGQSVTCTATVTSANGTPAGTVIFKDGATTLGTGTLNGSGQATYTTAALAVGSHSITAVYNGNGNFGTSTSPALPLNVNKGNTTTTITPALLNPSLVGQSVTVSYTVTANSPASGTPTGVVTITVNDTSGNTCSSTVAIGGCSLTLTTVGAKTVTATYGGDSNFNTSTSSGVTHQVNQAATATTVMSSANPSVFGQSITLTATLTVIAPGAGTPTGTVTFEDGTTTLGTRTLSSGMATLTTSSLALGSHTITAVYGGDTDFNTSTSSTLTQAVNEASTLTTITSSANPSVRGQPVTFTATVTVIAPGAGTPIGTVQFKVDGSNLGSAIALIDGSASSPTVLSLSVGNHTIIALYSGSNGFSPSTGTLGGGQTVNPVNNYLFLPLIRR